MNIADSKLFFILATTVAVAGTSAIATAAEGCTSQSGMWKQTASASMSQAVYTTSEPSFESGFIKVGHHKEGGKHHDMKKSANPDIVDTAETSDSFGNSLAVGDFNGDDRDDLAIGVPFEDIGTTTDAGMVNVIYGIVK